MVAATLACVACGGRLAEISKRDIWSPARVAQERPDLRYQLVAIDFLPIEVTLHDATHSFTSRLWPRVAHAQDTVRSRP
jgi:hypothetical protein